ncbi:MAG: inner membrane protein YiaA [Chloroflexota bacterium]
MTTNKPTSAFVLASWGVLITGMLGYMIGLWNASMLLNEKGYYFTVLMFGLFGAISVQKSVRDRLEKIPVTDIYYGLSWVATIMAVLLLVIGLYNATGMSLSEKGFYGMAFTLAMFAAITVQKNTRDLVAAGGDDSEPTVNLSRGFSWGKEQAES